MRPWAIAILVLVASSIQACSATTLRWISSRSSSGSESTGTDSGFTMVGATVLALMFWEEDIMLVYWDWKKEILTLPTITIHLISPSASFCLYFELRQNFPWNLIGFCISSGSQDEILEGGILLRPVTLS